MHPFRIAILIFLVGASVANYFAAREYRDRIAASTAGGASGFDWTKYGGTDRPVTPDPEIARLRAADNDRAWMREAIIVTIAGVAWFLLLGKNSKPSS